MDIKKHRKELGRHMRNFNYERTPSGILIDKGGMNALANGSFMHTLYRDGEADPALDPNLVVNEALDHMLNNLFNGSTQVTQWFVALFSGNVTPAAGWKGSTWRGLATEFTDYTPAARPEFITETTTTQSIDNSGDEALFTFVGAGLTVRGAVLVQASAKGADTGLLLAATRFAADRTGLGAPDKLGVQYVITAVDAGT